MVYLSSKSSCLPSEKNNDTFEKIKINTSSAPPNLCPLLMSSGRGYQNDLVREEGVLVRAVIVPHGEAEGSERQCSEQQTGN